MCGFDLSLFESFDCDRIFGNTQHPVLSRHPVPVPGLPCVFFILPQVMRFVKTFFRIFRICDFADTVDTVRTGHRSPRYAAVAVQPLFDCTRIISQNRLKVKKYFRIFRFFLQSLFLYTGTDLFAVSVRLALARFRFRLPSVRIPLLLLLSVVMTSPVRVSTADF